MIRVGIIGAGGISESHANGYLQLSNQVEIVAVADLDYERAQLAADRWGVKHAFADYRQMLKLNQIDAVSVCTFTKAHCQPSIDALEADKHVLVEKPMAATVDEAVRMVQASQKNNKILMVGMKWRFMPEVLAAKSFIEDQKLGEIYYAEAIGWQHRGIPGRTFIQKETSGGGAFMDNGVYTLDTVLYLMGHPKPVSVSGTSANIFGHSSDGNWEAEAFNVEDFGTALVRFEEGITLFFAHSWAINFKEQWQVRIAGSRGSAEIYPFSSPKLRLTHGGYSNLAESNPTHLPTGSIDISYEIKQFIEAIEHGLTSPVPANTFLYTNLIFDAIYRSTDLRREVIIELPDLLLQ